MLDVVIDVSCIYGLDDDGEGIAYDDKTASLIRLNNGCVLLLREVSVVVDEEVVKISAMY